MRMHWTKSFNEATQPAIWESKEKDTFFLINLSIGLIEKSVIPIHNM